MALLHIALQDGFVDDTVIVRFDGNEVFHKTGISSRTQIGYADSFEVTAGQEDVRVEVLVPSKDLAEAITLRVTSATYLGVSIEAGTIAHRISDEPFGYL